jgi:hypothetical protein
MDTKARTQMIHGHMESLSRLNDALAEIGVDAKCAVVDAKDTDWRLIDAAVQVIHTLSTGRYYRGDIPL